MERAGSKDNGRHLEIGPKAPFSELESRVKAAAEQAYHEKRN
jgi:hypothetical protein